MSMLSLILLDFTTNGFNAVLAGYLADDYNPFAA